MLVTNHVLLCQSVIKTVHNGTVTGGANESTLPVMTLSHTYKYVAIYL